MEEIMEIDIPDFQWNEYNRHYQNTSIETLDRINVNEADNLKKQFISIGFFLRLTKESGAYKELGYDTIEAYAYDRMGYSGSRTRRLMQINAMASKDGCSPVLDEQYKAFKSSQLQEMLSMLEDQRQMVTPDMTVRQIKDMKKAFAPIEIAGCQCTKVDEWTVDGDTYILGNCIDDNSFYYACVGGKDFEFDRKPTREEVESHYIDYLAMQDIDRHEAEVMGFCMSDTEAERKAAEAAKRQKEREREAEEIAAKYAPSSDPNELPEAECQSCYLNNNAEYGDMECHPERGEHKCYSGEDEDDEEDCATSHKTDPEKSIDELDLSVYTYNTLKRSGIDTIDELQDMSDEELAKLRGMGLRSLNEIKTKLKEYQAVLCDVAQNVANKPESVANAPENVSDQVIDSECIELPEEPVTSTWPDLLSDMPVFARVAVRDYLDKQEHELREYQKVEATDGNFPEALMLKKKMAIAGTRLLLKLVEGMEADDEEEEE